MKRLQNGFADKTPIARMREGARVGWPSLSDTFKSIVASVENRNM